MSQGTEHTRVVPSERMLLAIQRANQRRMNPESEHFYFGASKQSACCTQCGDLIRVGEQFVLNATTGRAWCKRRCWPCRP